MLLYYFWNLLLLLKVQAGRYLSWMDTSGLLMSPAAGVSTRHCHQEKHLQTILLTAQAELQPSTAPEQMLTSRDNSETNGFKSAYFLHVTHVLKRLTKSSLYPIAVQKSFHLRT